MTKRKLTPRRSFWDLTEMEKDEIAGLWDRVDNIKKIASKFNISSSTVYMVAAERKKQRRPLARGASVVERLIGDYTVTVLSRNPLVLKFDKIVKAKKAEGVSESEE